LRTSENHYKKIDLLFCNVVKYNTNPEDPIMNLRSDFEAENMEEMLYSELDIALSKYTSVRLREKVLREVCAKYELDECEIFELIDWFV